MLVRACEEAAAHGKSFEADPAIAIISGRIGFASPADTMSSNSWSKLIEICANGLDGTIELIDNMVQ